MKWMLRLTSFPYRDIYLSERASEIRKKIGWSIILPFPFDWFVVSCALLTKWSQIEADTGPGGVGLKKPGHLTVSNPTPFCYLCYVVKLLLRRRKVFNVFD